MRGDSSGQNSGLPEWGGGESNSSDFTDSNDIGGGEGGEDNGGRRGRGEAEEKGNVGGEDIGGVGTDWIVVDWSDLASSSLVM